MTPAVLSDVQPALAANHFDRTVLAKGITVADEAPELLSLAVAEPIVAGVVGWVDLTAPDVPTRLAALVAQPGGESPVSLLV